MKTSSERPSAFDIQLIEPVQFELVRHSNTCRLFATISLLCFSTFYYGYTLTYLSGVPSSTLSSVFGQQVQTTTGQVVLLGSPTAGAALGALVAPFVMKFFSRRNFVLVINLCAFIIGCVVQIPNMYVLLVFRVLQGVCFGQYMALVPIYIHEVCPRELAGQFGVFTQLFVVVGIVLTYLNSVILHEAGAIPQVQWRFQFAFTQLTIIVQTIMFLSGFIPESPNSYLHVHNSEDARLVIELFHKKQFLDEVLREKIAQIQMQKGLDSSRSKNQNYLAVQPNGIHNANNLKVSWIAIFIGFELPLMQQLTGCNAISTQAGPIISTFSPDLAIYTPLIIQVVQLFANIVPIFMLKRVGRKSLILFGNGSLGVLDLIMGFLLLYNSWNPSQYLMIVILIIFQILFATTIGPLTWLYIPEILPPKLVPFATVTNWIGATLCIVIVPIVSAHFNNQPYPAFFFFAGFSLLCLPINSIWMIETKGKSKEQIVKQFKHQK